MVLNGKENELKKVKENVNNLLQEKEQLEQKLEELQEDIEQAQLKLVRAQKLTTLLKNEKLRWQESVEQSQQVLQ